MNFVRTMLALCGVLSITGCMSMTPNYVDLPAPSRSGGVAITVDRAVRAPYGYVGLRGTVTNETDEIVKQCRITIRLYNNQMERERPAKAVVDDLYPTETRDYYAEFPSPLKLVRTVLKPTLRLTW